MNTLIEVNSLLADVLSLDGRSARFNLETPLLGALPELDSMAVIALITGMEERFGFIAEDDEIEGSTFATVGSLVAFIDGKLISLGRSRKNLRTPH
ncbi:acyl carrier protein [Rhodocyclus tenuis]|nr:acyl carrier protein [Rhodocyclus tenuis]MBK1679307.1 acyl carrier protein [Rhodocyclus tenuis]